MRLIACVVLPTYNEYRPHTSLGNQTPEQFESEWHLSRTPKEGIF